MLNKNLSKLFPAFLLIFTLILSLNFSHAASDSDWELVYENSSTGQKLCGNIDELIDAVLNGKDVKVVLHFDSENLHYQMSLSKVKVDLKEKTVTGYNYDFRQNQSEKDVYSRISTYATNGEYISIYEDNNYYRNPEIINVAMSWYVEN